MHFMLFYRENVPSNQSLMIEGVNEFFRLPCIQTCVVLYLNKSLTVELIRYCINSLAFIKFREHVSCTNNSVKFWKNCKTRMKLISIHS